MLDTVDKLHKSHLEDFKTWLTETKLLAYRPGKGTYQVLQVETADWGWQVIFITTKLPDHFTVNEKLIPLITEYYKYRRQLKTC